MQRLLNPSIYFNLCKEYEDLKSIDVFNLDLNGYQPERYYTLQYKVVSGSGTVDETNTFYDEGFTFKVTL